MKELYVVDIASSNGVSDSPFLPFFKEGAKGLAVEVDVDKFSQLAYMYRNFPDVTLVRTKVTPHNVASLLLHADVPKEFDVINIDIDSYDLDLITSVLRAEYRPSLISIEINEKIPPPIYFDVPYSKDHVWDGSHFYGCSIVAATTVLSRFDYGLVDLEFNNALFQSSRSSPNLPRLQSPLAWLKGYKNRKETPQLFGHNSDVNSWLVLEPEQAVDAIREHFSSHAGQFKLFIQ
jgi:hypothetical protein